MAVFNDDSAAVDDFLCQIFLPYFCQLYAFTIRQNQFSCGAKNSGQFTFLAFAGDVQFYPGGNSEGFSVAQGVFFVTKSFIVLFLHLCALDFILS